MAFNLRTVLRRIRDWFTDAPALTPREALKDMYKAHEARADSASYSMARADDLFDKLQAELANHDSLGREAERFMTQEPPDEEAARRCLALQIQSASEIKRLQAEYGAAQQQAEMKVVAFQAEKRELDDRSIVLPSIEERQRLNQIEEGIQRRLDSFSMDGPKRQFDAMAREIKVRERQLANRAVLTADPNAALDQRIRQAIDERTLNEAFSALKKRIADSGVVDGELVSSANDIQDARRLLEAPRYSTLGLTARRPQRQLVERVARKE